jgi:hypothetical protein
MSSLACRRTPENEGFPEFLRHRDRQGGRRSTQPSPRPPPWAPRDAGCDARRDTGSPRDVTADATWPRQAANNGRFPGVLAPGEARQTSPLFDLPPPIHGCSQVSLGPLAIVPITKNSEDQSDYRTYADRTELGAGWRKTSVHRGLVPALPRWSPYEYRHATCTYRAGRTWNLTRTDQTCPSSATPRSSAHDRERSVARRGERSARGRCPQGARAS